MEIPDNDSHISGSFKNYSEGLILDELKFICMALCCCDTANAAVFKYWYKVISISGLCLEDIVEMVRRRLSLCLFWAAASVGDKDL